MKLAIIGAGISGLTVAWRLGRDHAVTLIEAADYLGGHTNTVDVEWDGVGYAVDTGFIVFNRRTYPGFTAMLAELGVASEETSMTFSVRCDRTGLEYRGADLNGFFAQRRNVLNPRFWNLLWDMVRFLRRAPALLAEDEQLTVGDYFRRERYSRAFREQYFLPMGSAVWSCPPGEFAKFPLRSLVDFYWNHGLLSWRDRPVWRVIRGGSRQYVEAMRRRMQAEVCLRTPVERVERHADRVTVRTAGWVRDFDHVVFACHSDQALRLLGDGATSAEREVLGCFPYVRNVAVLHTDDRVLPRCRRAWASWNYRIPAADASQATVTYNMNLLQHLQAPVTFCVTLNGESWIDPSRVLRRIEYAHPLFDARRPAAQRRHGELLQANRTSFCGAYWGHGFHEDGVNSGLAVCAALGAASAGAVSSEAWPVVVDAAKGTLAGVL
ncbi:MAG: NAD(P)/FAD-dependent oxidoreductase [Pirellulaceae bacterium]